MEIEPEELLNLNRGRKSNILIVTVESYLINLEKVMCVIVRKATRFPSICIKMGFASIGMS